MLHLSTRGGMKGFGPSQRWTLGLFLALTLVSGAFLASAAFGHSRKQKVRGSGQRWEATWAAAPQAPSAGDAALGLIPASNPGVTGFSNQTVRNIVFTSVGGDEARIHLSNAFGTGPVEIGQATVGEELSGAELAPGTVRSLTFNGNSSVTIPAGSEVVSDPVRMLVRPLEDLAISIYLPNATGPTTYHAFSQQLNYVAPGNEAAVEDPSSYAGLPSASGPPYALGSSWYYVSGVDVVASRWSPGTVVGFGDSITDGTNSQINANDRWPSLLAKRLDAALGDRAPAVVDEGIGGNRVLSGSPCFGESALTRFNRDVLSVPGVRDVILLEGINDIGLSGAPNTGCSVPATVVTPTDIIHGYEQLIAAAHARGVKIFGATLTPVNDNAFEPDVDAINHWIRTSGAFDGVVDFNRAVSDPTDPLDFNPSDDSGDHLHPNDSGYQAMADSINLRMLLR